MLKQGLIYLLLSIFVAFFAHYIQVCLVYLDIIYTYSNLKLAPLFSDTSGGKLLRSIILLTILPVLITLIPNLIYRTFKGQLMPYYYEITWVFWLIIVVSKISII
jgi:hypothetical protein